MKCNGIIVLISLLLLFSCEEAKERKPENILPKETMVQLLADIHVEEGKILRKNLHADTALALFHFRSASIFDQYDTDSAVFHKSFLYYSDHPDQLHEIYNAVQDTLGVRESMESKRK